MVFGSIATLIGAVGSYCLRHNKWLVCVPPILANAIIVPWVLRYAYGSTDLIPVAMVTAVSYTHLDVYKRQSLPSTLVPRNSWATMGLRPSTIFV